MPPVITLKSSQYGHRVFGLGEGAFVLPSVLLGGHVFAQVQQLGLEVSPLVVVVEVLTSRLRSAQHQFEKVGITLGLLPYIIKVVRAVWRPNPCAPALPVGKGRTKNIRE